MTILSRKSHRNYFHSTHEFVGYYSFIGPYGCLTKYQRGTGASLTFSLGHVHQHKSVCPS